MAQEDPDRHADDHPGNREQARLQRHDAIDLTGSAAERAQYTEVVPAPPHREHNEVSDREQRDHDEEYRQSPRQPIELTELLDLGVRHRSAGRIAVVQRLQPLHRGGPIDAGTERDQVLRVLAAGRLELRALHAGIREQCSVGQRVVVRRRGEQRGADDVKLLAFDLDRIADRGVHVPQGLGAQGDLVGRDRPSTAHDDEPAVALQEPFREARNRVPVHTRLVVGPNLSNGTDVGIGGQAIGGGLRRAQTESPALKPRTITSPPHPWRAGSVVSRVSDPEKTATPITPAIASAVPATAERNGIARRPRPGSLTMLTAVVVVTPPIRSRFRRAGRRGTPAARVRPTHTAAATAKTITTAARTIAPPIKTVTSKSRPASELGAARGADRHPTRADPGTDRREHGAGDRHRHDRCDRVDHAGCVRRAEDAQQGALVGSPVGVARQDLGDQDQPDERGNRGEHEQAVGQHTRGRAEGVDDRREGPEVGDSHRGARPAPWPPRTGCR